MDAHTAQEERTHTAQDERANTAKEETAHTAAKETAHVALGEEAQEERAEKERAEALANAYNNMGNVLRLHHADRVDEAVLAYLGAAHWMPQVDKYIYILYIFSIYMYSIYVRM